MASITVATREERDALHDYLIAKLGSGAGGNKVSSGGAPPNCYVSDTRLSAETLKQYARLASRAKDAIAPIPLGRAKDIANDPRTQLDSRRAELREARRKIAEYSGKPGVTARFDRQINELTREVEKLEKKVAALPPDKPLSERIKGNDVLRDFARKVLAR